MDPGTSSTAMDHRDELIDHKDTLKDCIVAELKEMYLSEILCDVTILATNKRFPCHRVVLASVSPYFKALFTCPMKESMHGDICLSDVPSTIMETVLHYIYTGEALLTLDNVEELFIVSSRLQVTALEDLCSSYLKKRIDNGNCLWIYRLAHSHHHRNLLETALNHIGENLSSLSGKEDFLHLEMEELVTILSSDNLMVSSELAVYNVARTWWEYRTPKDNPLPTELLKVIRMPLLTPEELKKVGKDVPSDDFPFQSPTKTPLRQGMFEERIICMDIMALEETDPVVEDYLMQAYDPTTNSWEKLPFFGHLDNAGIVSVGYCLYVSGGFSQERCASNALHVYDSVLNEWKELAPMLHPRACHGFLAYGNMLYAFGGCSKRKLTDSMECFSVLDNSWRSVSSMPLALHSFASAVLKGKLFAIGGMTETGIDGLFHYPGFHIYDLLTDTWSQFPLPVMFSAAGAVTMDDKLYVIASYETRHGDHSAYTADDAYPPYDDYKAYMLYHEQPNTKSKSFCMDHLGRICQGTIPPLLKSISGSAVVRWKNRIYIVGGSDDDGMSHYKMFYWSPGAPRWTSCKKELPFLFVGLPSVTLWVPLKHLASIVPGRRLNYNFRSDSEEENEEEPGSDSQEESEEEPRWRNW